MNIFSAFDTSVMVALLLGIEFLRSDIRMIPGFLRVAYIRCLYY